jgi:hypothetical protein
MIIFLKQKYLRGIETIKKGLGPRPWPLDLVASQLNLSLEDASSLVEACGFISTDKREEYKDSFGKWMQTSRLTHHDLKRNQRTRQQIMRDGDVITED